MGGSPEGWEAKFRAVFPSPATIFFLFFSLLGSFRGILGRRGFTRQPESQTCTFEGPGAIKHQIPRKGPPEREEKTEKIVAGEGKKRAKFWAVQEKGGPGKGGLGAVRGTEHDQNTMKP